MTLPELTLPKVDLPFDIPVLLHPSVDHFAIALPVIIILLEFYNLFARKKSVGGFSFILIVFTVIAFGTAYFTGIVDGKVTFDLLSVEGKEELREHKLLGTYLLLGSVVLLFFKLLAMTGKGFFKFLFFLVLIGLTAVTLEQGKEGGELVYEYGANVERVKALDDELFDVQEELEEKLDKVKKDAVNVEKSITDTTMPKTSEKPEIEVDKVLPSKVEVIETSETTLEDVKKSFEEAMKL